MKRLFIVSLATAFIICCNKPKTDGARSCFRARFVGGGCWPVIQILDFPFDRLPTTWFGNYSHTIGVYTLPAQYKDGKPFYFTATRVDSNIGNLDYCIPTKYLVRIDSLSRSPCK